MNDAQKLVDGLSGFTPGPWRAIPQGGGSTVVCKTLPPRNERRSEVAYGYAGDDFCVGYPFVDDDRPDSIGVRFDFISFGHADAQLISAAPDLHAAVVVLLADNAKLRAALIVWEAAYDNTLMRSGVCCCGDDMETHSPPMNCGHSPVDSGEYYAASAIMQTRAALEATK